MAKSADDVIVHRVSNKKKKVKKEDSVESAPDTLKFDKQFTRNIKVLSLFFMLVSFLLLIALVSYTPKDEAFLDIKAGDIVGLIKGNEQIIAKAELTNNWLGLVGAGISNYLYNYTFGYAVLLSPFFMFYWAYDLFKIQRISDKALKNTMLYLVLGLLFAGIMGTFAKLTWMPEISKEFSGIAGYYIASVLYSIIGGIGSSLFLFLLVGVTMYFGFGIQFELAKNVINNVASADKSGFKKYLSYLTVPYNKLLEYTRRDSVGKSPEVKIEKAQDTTPEKIDISNYPDEENIHTQNIAKNTPERVHSVHSAKVPFANEQQHNIADTARIIRQNIDAGEQRGIFDDDEDELTGNSNLKPAFVGIRDHSVALEDTPTRQVPTKIINPIIQDIVPNDYLGAVYDDDEPESEEEIPKPEPIILNLSKPSSTPKIEKANTEERVLSVVIENKALEESMENSDDNIPSFNKQVVDKSITENIEPLAEDSVSAPIVIENYSKPQPDLAKKPLQVYLHDPVEEDILKKIPKSPISTMSLDEKINYIFPTIELLAASEENHHINEEELKMNAKILQEKLETFKIVIENLTITPGPVVTQYEFVPAAGIKISRIGNLSDDIAMALKARGIRIIAPIPGKGTVGIEIPNQNPAMVRFSSIIKSAKFHNNNYRLPLALGKTINGEVYIADLAKMPHLLIAGSTGSGKSVGINTVIASLLYKLHPRNLKFVIIDPKKVELRQYEALERHFLALSPDIDETIITDPQDAVIILKSLCAEMDLRYDILASVGQRNIFDYNEKVREGKIKDTDDMPHRAMPFIVCIIDELADLMLTASKEIETPIIRLAQLARAVGIHLVVATQRPSVDVITGIIKANFPARASYLVASKIDSRTILDVMGAEQLLGNGDMLFLAGGSPKPIRVQNAFISTDEVEALCEHIGNQKGFSEPYYLPSIAESADPKDDINKEDRDVLFEEAAKLVIRHQTASVSLIQRRLKVGYARAGRIIDELEAAGVISQFDGSKSRSVYLESDIDLHAIL